LPEAVPRPFPALTFDTEFFWTAGRDGKLRFQRCQDCSTYLHPPKPVCPVCLSKNIKIEDVSGRASLATFTINHHTWHPAFTPPYVIALVEIEEAAYVRLMTQIVGCDPAAVEIGMPLEVRFEQVGPAWLPLFAPRRA
jgi:uncharacterized protein